MPSFPVTIAAKMALNYPLSRTSRFNTGVVRFADDTEQRWQRQAHLAGFVLTLRGLTRAERDAVVAFYITRKGRFAPFDITVDAVLYQYMLFASDTLSFTEDPLPERWNMQIELLQIRANDP
jgi:hypothetical protein